MRVGIVDARATSELRRAVLRPSWPVGSVMHGDDDPAALHFALYDDGALSDDRGALLCACVLFERPFPVFAERLPAWQLRGMATAEFARGRGVGARMLAAVADDLAARGARLVWCEARQSAVAFYARNRFSATGEMYIARETGLAHLMMWRELVRPPTSS